MPWTSYPLSSSSSAKVGPVLAGDAYDRARLELTCEWLRDQ
jgi:hypothetical protein